MSHVDAALAAFGKTCNCCQAVLTAFQEDAGITRETVMCAGRGFGGGMGQGGKTCGCVTGGIAALGFLAGAVPQEQERETRQATYDRVAKFLAEFRSEHGAIDCRDLIGLDLSTPEGQKLNKDKGITRALCPAYVRTAVEAVEKAMAG